MRQPFVKLAMFLILVAVVYWCLYFPLYTNDSAYYLQLARAILRGTFFSQDTGARTPLFPLLLAVLGASGQAVFALNLALGVLTSVLLFRIFELLTSSRGVATAAAVVFMLNPSTVWCEREVLTESLSAFLIALGTLFVARACSPQASLARMTGVSSTAFSFAALARPVFQLLPLTALVVILALTPERPLERRRAYKAVAAGLTPFAVLVIGCAGLNYYRFGWFTLTTWAGYNLTNHTGQFMRDAPPVYSKVASIYMRYEQAHLRAWGMRSGTIWDARLELMQATGMNDIQLSRLLLGLSARLIVSHPAGYLQSVGRSFKRYWHATVYARGCNIGDFLRGLREVRAGRTAWFELLYPYLYLPLVLAYGLSLGGPLVVRSWRKGLWTPGMWVVHSVILYSALTSSLAEYGENNRYKFPVEGLMIGMAFVMFYVICQSYTQWRTARNRMPAQNQGS
jgi:4-amino-4-deoxy-L-arabinose transferase-like glycosyltransferase